ncbi:unnamed protein product [Lactuca virosa]|uniref:DUF674 family protein n=1 Tax=Lactuca virosa TaxID=75947 RepID=A0AAU9ND97_9ASTR|nr:unnamed protein product [Lactuca virosa]
MKSSKCFEKGNPLLLSGAILAIPFCFIICRCCCLLLSPNLLLLEIFSVLVVRVTYVGCTCASTFIGSKGMVGTNEKSVQLKVFIDKNKNKVMFAEAEEDFVETLFSFFTLPLGTIAKLLRKQADLKYTKVGSLTSLYESVVNLNPKYFSNEESKDVFVNTRNSSTYFCERLKINLDPTKPKFFSYQGDTVFVKKKANFIITDDLNVAPLMLDTGIMFLKSLGVENINLLEERTIYFGVEEFLNLLKWSLFTKNPLSNIVLGGSNSALISSNTTKTKTVKSLVQESNKKIIYAQVKKFFVELFFCILSIVLCAFTRLTKDNSSPVGKRDSDLFLGNSGQTRTVKLLIQKSKNKLLCAQVENPFVELLLSFLTIPLGTYIRLMKEKSSPLGIYNLYNSIACLADGKYLKSEDLKTKLLCPERAIDYFHLNHCLVLD